MSLTQEQLRERRAYLGGTDAAAVAGVNPPGWAQPIDVYLDKMGLALPRPVSTAMQLGSMLEPIVAELFTQATGIPLRRAAKPVRSRQYPWAGGHLDRWAPNAVFEAKTASNPHAWGPSSQLVDGQLVEAEPPKVPLHYAVQVQHYLAVTGRPLGYLAVLLGFGDFRWYALPRDEELIRLLMQLEERFWREHVLAQVAPPLDGSEGYSQHLRRRFGADDGTEAVATPEQQNLLRQLQVQRQQLEAAKQAEAATVQQLQLSMGDTARLLAPNATVVWTRNRETQRVDWQALATELLREVNEFAVREGAPAAPWPKTKKAQAELVLNVATGLGLVTVEPGARPFRVQFSDEE